MNNPREILEQLGIIPPESEAACLAMHRYLLEGDCVGSTYHERLASIQFQQKTFLGQRVAIAARVTMLPDSFVQSASELSRVIYRKITNRYERYRTQNPPVVSITCGNWEPSIGGSRPSPLVFWAKVRFDDGKEQVIPLSCLKVFDDSPEIQVTSCDESDLSPDLEQDISDFLDSSVDSSRFEG
ncbi:MAG: hypothetical protein ABIB04_04240 [Patescibacteria group bacterium]